MTKIKKLSKRKELNLILELKRQKIDKKTKKKTKNEYTSKNADWSKLTHQVETYNPFYYLDRSKDYKSNKNWSPAGFSDKTKEHKIILKFNFRTNSEKPENPKNSENCENKDKNIKTSKSLKNKQKQKNNNDKNKKKSKNPENNRDYCSMGIVITDNEDRVLLKRGYYIGFKEKLYAILIGFTYALNILEDFDFLKIKMFLENKNFMEFFVNGDFESLDPFQEKTALIAKEKLKIFESFKISFFSVPFKVKKIVREQADFVLDVQMDSFIRQCQLTQLIKNSGFKF